MDYCPGNLPAPQAAKGLPCWVDPDKVKSGADLDWMSQQGFEAVHTVLLGGSLVTEGSMDTVAAWIRERTETPIVLFPGSPNQLTSDADALLFLSVISGRNPDALIGKHVEAATRVRELGLDAVGCGYMLIDGGRTTTAHYMSGSLPIPGDKPDIAGFDGVGRALPRPAVHVPRHRQRGRPPGFKRHDCRRARCGALPHHRRRAA